MAICPCCGHPYAVDGLVVDLNTNTAVSECGAAKLTPKGAEILSVLIDAAPKRVPQEKLVRQVYGALSDASHARIEDVICQNRRRIEATGYAIRCERHHSPASRGYWLERVTS